MSWSGGTYSKGNSGTGGWAGDAASGIGIEAGRHDTQDNDFATGINNCIAKDGQNTPTNDLPMGGYHHTGVSNATANDQYAAWGQLRNGAPVYLDTANTRLGVGTSSPTGTLDVQTTDTAAAYIQQFGANNNGARISLRKSRNASIGGNTIVQLGDNLGSILFSGANGTGYTSGALIASDVDGTPGATNDMPANLRFFTTPDGSGTVTERVRISSSGNVGIGTSTPSVALDVLGNVRLADVETDATTKVGRIKGRSYTNSQGDWMVLDAQGLNADNQIIMGGGSASNNCATTLKFVTAANTTSVTGFERMRIDSTGNVGIAGTSASSRFYVKGETANNTRYALALTDSTPNDLFTVRCDGQIITGTRTLSPYNNTTASAVNMYVSAGGELQRSTSSLKYKTDIQDANHGLADVLNLRAVTYKGKNDGDRIFGGLIAEEVDAAGLTEFVQYAEDGSPDALAYGNMVSLAFKAIQELNAKVESLEARITALENA